MNLRRIPATLLAAIFTIAALAASPAQAGPDSVQLRMKGKKGDEHVYTQKEKSTVSMTITGAPVPELKISFEDLVMRSVTEMTMKVEDVSDAGDLTLRMSVGEPEISFSGGVFPFTQSDMMNMITELATQQMSGREAKMFKQEMEKAMSGQNEIAFTVTDRGKPLSFDIPWDQQGLSKREAKQASEMMNMIFSSLPSTYPERPVRPGDSWAVSYDLPEMLNTIAADAPQIGMFTGMLNLPVITIEFEVDGYEMFEGREYMKLNFRTEGGWDLGAMLGMLSAPLSQSPFEISGRQFRLTGLDFDMAWKSEGYMLYDYRKSMNAKSFSDTTVIVEFNGMLRESGGEKLTWPMQVRIEQNSLELVELN